MSQHNKAPQSSYREIESMRLLTSSVGWASNDRHVFWTTDAGKHWKNIGPRIKPRQNIDAVFFLDTSIGWTLLIGEDEGAVEPTFELASTKDAGASWSTSSINIPNDDPEVRTLTGGSHIDFVDALHGWMNIPIVSGSAFCLGALFVTSDGGKTWNWVLESPGVSGSIRFLSLRDGWLAGGPGDQSLHVTHDQSASWQNVGTQVQRPSGTDEAASYDLPTFEDGRNGFLPVTYSERDGSGKLLALFSTHDSGKTWKQDRVLPRLSGSYTGLPVPSAVVDSNLLIVDSNDDSGLRFLTVTSDGKIESKTARLPPRADGAIFQLSFVSRNRGWVLTKHTLLSTSDGADTWTDITPPRSGPMQ